MNGFAYILPVRNDLSGINIQVLDLLPNTALRNAQEVPGQTFYVRSGADQPGPTRTSLGALIGGSLTTDPLAALQPFDYSGKGTPQALGVPGPEYGLGAYLRERTQVDPAGASRALAPAEVTKAILFLFKAALSGSPLTALAVNAILAAAAGVARADLVPADNTSAAFGSIADLLAVIGGGTYLVPPGVPVTDPAGKFFGSQARLGLAGLLPPNLAPPVSGSFLDPRAPGARGYRMLGLTDALLASYASGDLSKLRYGASPIQVRNPNFAYSDHSVTSYRPRAVMLDGTAVPEDGTTLGVFMVYLEDGTPL